jgi:hypothetical protein
MPILREPHLRHTRRAFSLPSERFGDPVPHHPGDPLPRDQERNPSPFLARNLGIHEKILEFLRARQAERLKPIPRAPGSKTEGFIEQPRTQNLSVGIFAV